jgi:hypothetical protein
MPDLKDQQRGELFEKIRNCLSSLETEATLEPIERTEIIFDVLEQILARCISSSAADTNNLNEIMDKSTANIKAAARKFFERSQQ